MDKDREDASSCHLTGLCSEVGSFEIGLVAVSVSWGHQDEMPQIGRLKQEKLVFSRFWRLEIQNQGVNRVIPFGGSEKNLFPCPF